MALDGSGPFNLEAYCTCLAPCCPPFLYLNPKGNPIATSGPVTAAAPLACSGGQLHDAEPEHSKRQTPPSKWEHMAPDGRPLS